jgi:hypothetical protein
MDGHEGVALTEANRIRIEVLAELEPGWSETVEETAAYLAGLGKTPLDYVEAWQRFRPSLAVLRRRHPHPGPAWSRHRTARSRAPEPAVSTQVASGGRWFRG